MTFSVTCCDLVMTEVLYMININNQKFYDAAIDAR
jgi:hypothetical protein